MAIAAAIEGASEQSFALLHVPARGHRNLGESLEVLGLGGDDHVDILGAPHDTPCVQGKTADYDELDAGIGKTSQ